MISNGAQNGRLKSPLPGHKIHLRYVVTPRRVYHKYYNVLCNPLPLVPPALHVEPAL